MMDIALLASAGHVLSARNVVMRIFLFSRNSSWFWRCKFFPCNNRGKTCKFHIMEYVTRDLHCDGSPVVIRGGFSEFLVMNGLLDGTFNVRWIVFT